MRVGGYARPMFDVKCVLVDYVHLVHCDRIRNNIRYCGEERSPILRQAVTINSVAFVFVVKIAAIHSLYPQHEWHDLQNLRQSQK